MCGQIYIANNNEIHKLLNSDIYLIILLPSIISIAFNIKYLSSSKIIIKMVSIDFLNT